ncbi:Ankyrin repeat-containing protein ITN1 [Linum grandiflorum]
MAIKHCSSNADDASALYEAAITGDTSALHRLIKRDSLILKRSRLSSFGETPLHISVLAGHVDFTRELLHQDPEMAAELDSSNSTPLHLAAAPGHTEIVRILLGVVGAADACLVRDEDGRIPLHLAAIRGRVGIVRELVLARPESVLEKLDGDTVLHLCVKYNHLDALKLLVEMIDLSSIMWLGDRDGNTILHLAVKFKQVQTTSYLASLPNMRESALDLLNGQGSTALDCLELHPKDYKSQQIQNRLVKASQDHPTPSNLAPFPSEEAPVTPKRGRISNCCTSFLILLFRDYLGNETDWPGENLQDTVLLLATITASMSFQAATNPPGGVWSENRTSSEFGKLCNNTTSICKAGTAIQAYGDYPRRLDLFVTFNNVAFGASLWIMLLIVCGTPKKSKVWAWLLTQSICAALSSMTVAFVLAGLLVIPSHADLATNVSMLIFLGAWLLMIALISLADSFQFLVWTGKIIGALWSRRSKGWERV